MQSSCRPSHLRLLWCTTFVCFCGPCTKYRMRMRCVWFANASERRLGKLHGLLARTIQRIYHKATATLLKNFLWIVLLLPFWTRILYRQILGPGTSKKFFSRKIICFQPQPCLAKESFFLDFGIFEVLLLQGKEITFFTAEGEGNVVKVQVWLDRNNTVSHIVLWLFHPSIWWSFDTSLCSASTAGPHNYGALQSIKSTNPLQNHSERKLEVSRRISSLQSKRTAGSFVWWLYVAPKSVRYCFPPRNGVSQNRARQSVGKNPPPSLTKRSSIGRKENARKPPNLCLWRRQ